MAASRWVKARPLGVRVAVGVVSSIAVVWFAVWSILGAVADPNVPSVTLALLTVSFAVMVLVMAVESIANSLVSLRDEGYATLLGGVHRWADVLAIGAGLAEGRRVPVVALRSDSGFPIAEDAFPGFADVDADRLIEALREGAGALPGFASVELPADWRAQTEAEADRVEAEVERATGRRPVARTWIEYGFTGLESALELRYGPNGAGEEIVLLVRRSAELALEIDGVRYVRVTKKRSPDPVTQVATLFGEHESEKVAATETGFEQIVVRAGEGKPILFNAEEPDHYAV